MPGRSPSRRALLLVPSRTSSPTAAPTWALCATATLISRTARVSGSVRATSRSHCGGAGAGARAGW